MMKTVSSTGQKLTSTTAQPKIAWPLILAAVLLFLPAAILFLLGTSSNTAGLTIACTVVCFGSVIGGRAEGINFAGRAFAAGLGLVILLAVHLFIAVNLPLASQNVDMSRTAVSFIVLVVVATTAAIVADWLLVAPPVIIDRIGTVVRAALLAIAIFCFLGYQPPSQLSLMRPSFPFNEPSHFALVAAPFIIDGCVRASLIRRLVWLAIWLMLAVANQSLSLIVAIAIAGAVSLPLAYTIVTGAAVAAASVGVDLQYFGERLDFSPDSNNLSALVYRQGWEQLQQGLAYNHGWGIGFQQLGFAPLNTPTSDVIYRLLHDDSNLRDGSFLAAKLIGELGIFGLGIVAMSLVFIAWSAMRLRAMISVPGHLQPSHLRFCAAVVCALPLELFVRGIGYFSSTIVLVLAAAMVLRAPRDQISL